MALQTVKGYGVSASGSWTSVADAVGPPNGLYARTSTTSVMTVDLTGALAAIPDTAAISAVYMGTTGYVGSGARLNLQLSAGDTTLRNMLATTTVSDLEVQLNPGLFTVAMLKGTLSVAATRTNTAVSIFVDAVWLRVVYSVGPAAGSKGWATSVATAGWNATNSPKAVGEPDGISAASSSASATLVLNMDPLPVPDGAELAQVYIGARAMGASTGGTLVAWLSAGVTANQNLPTSTVMSDVETWLGPDQFTPALLRSGVTMSLRCLNTNTTINLDAVWWRAVYSMPATGRTQRWTGTSWVDTALKRWDGSAWQTMTVKRWSGSAWV